MTTIVAGVDEVGVGPIAGPVVAAAVILNPSKKIYKLRDSKILTSKQREVLYSRIMAQALEVAIGIASVDEIDQLNIYHGTMLAMQRAIHHLKIKPTLVLIDGRSKPSIEIPVQTIVRGDQTVKSISAASIIAKVTRDSIMNRYQEEFPLYCFGQHKGYSTKQHRQLVIQHGITTIHRRSFSFIKNILSKT